EREFQNMFTFSAGFEAATLKIPNKEYTAYGQTSLSLPPRKQIIGFAKFRSRAEALQARDVLQGRRVDIEKGAVLKAEMAKKNLHTKRGVGPGSITDSPMLEYEGLNQLQSQLATHHEAQEDTDPSRRGTVDQNPPINTLYVGNLPTSPPPAGYPNDYLEDTLRDLFQVRPGFRKLCFRHKANGPMCFVEFEDVHYAARAMQEMTGNTLRGVVKNGIRLSYSKNPLGVR
ncbi:hypothetical protein BJ165DRAFT_1312047, partial [Panaeolus papilionaceus]